MPSLIELAQTDPDKARKRLGQVRTNAYNQGYMDGIIDTLSKNDTVVQLGANIGATTVKLAASQAKIMAFEADPIAYEKLTTNVANMPNVETQNAAAGCQNSTVSFFRVDGCDEEHIELTERTSLYSHVSVNNDAGEVQLFDTVAMIKALVKEHGELALLYVDINGSELEIMEALAEENLFDHIRVSIVHTYQKDFAVLRDRYRTLREKTAARPEWCVKFLKE